MDRETREIRLAIERAHTEAKIYGGPASMFGLSLALGGAAALQRTSVYSVVSAVNVALYLRDGSLAERWLRVKLNLR